MARVPPTPVMGAFRLREAADRTDAMRRIGAAVLVVLGAVLLAID